MTNDPRESLRHATASLHERVDACMPLARPAATLGDYQDHLVLLQAWVGALRQCRPSLAPRLSQEASALDVDLATCQRLLDEPLPRVSLLPLRVDAPAYASAGSDDFDWGIAYVLEGSRLGGQVLYRRLAERLAPHPLDYLRGAGASTGLRWKSFLAELGDALDTPQKVQRACDGAARAFELLLQCRIVDRNPAETTR